MESAGPLTGKELLKLSRLDEFTLWSMCNRSDQIITAIAGRRYLRLDSQVAGYARLSPSIMREFYGYTIIVTERQAHEISQRMELLEKEIREISRKKIAIAQKTSERIMESHPESGLLKECACFLIAGDVVYGMAHAEARPELSTGELVKGSDLDIIVVTDNLPDGVMKSLDASIYDEKYKLLMNPAGREEIDYIVKDISRIDEQLQFSSFKDMVASKILDEARFLYGSRELLDRIRRMLAERGIPEKLLTMEKKALLERKEAESYLLDRVNSISRDEWMKLFYTKEEKEEIF